MKPEVRERLRQKHARVMRARELTRRAATLAEALRTASTGCVGTGEDSAGEAWRFRLSRVDLPHWELFYSGQYTAAQYQPPEGCTARDAVLSGEVRHG